MKDYLSIIRKPIEADLAAFSKLFDDSLSHSDGQLNAALNYIRQRTGKRMRPMLTILAAKVFGNTSCITYRAGVGLELLHTASLVHDDVVDESSERRGQKSVNAVYNNKIAVLVGDYILSAALLNVCATSNVKIVTYLSKLGQTLSNGEILQLTSNGSDIISEEAYYSVIKQKTAALFEACCTLGAMSVSASDEDVQAASLFGQQLGIIFQIRDDIFDYYDNPNIGKPTGNDMVEGKLTLPAIYAVLSTNDADMKAIALKIKQQKATPDEISQLVAFTKQNGGIEYAEKVMRELHDKARRFIDDRVGDPAIKTSLSTYLDYCIERDY